MESKDSMWHKTIFISKLKVWFVHLGISCLLFAPLLWVIGWVWFPAPFFSTDGGWQGIRILAAIDLVLGPTLTFMVFNPRKSPRELRFDLTCIALVQAAALAFGLVAIEGERPWVMSYHGDAFYSISKRSFADQHIEPAAWAELGDGPVFRVFVREPRTEAERSGVATHALVSGLGPQALMFLYDPIFLHWNEIKAKKLDPTMLCLDDVEWCASFREMLADHRLREDQAVLIPLHGAFDSTTLLLDPNAKLLGSLP